MTARDEHWWAVRIAVSDEILEPISNFVFDLGALGCLQNDDELVAYFPGDRDLEMLQFDVAAYLSQLQELGLVEHTPEFIVEQVTNQDWATAWKKGLRPIRVSNRLVVKPSWEVYTPTIEDEIVLDIDPKQAFGTGTHATTQLCLRAVERLIGGGEEVLDIGTGTAVLAIAAVKLGAKRALGIDVDPIALDAARENVDRNGVADRVELRQTRLAELPARRYHLIVANLNRRVIEEEVLPHLHGFADARSWIVLSGILREEVDRFFPELIRHGLDLKSLETQDEWVAAHLRYAKAP